MPKFRKKPVIIEAIQWTGDVKSIEKFMHLKALTYITDYGNSDVSIEINTSEGTVVAKLGDWVIKGIHGEFYTRKPSIFEKTHEEVKPPFTDSMFDMTIQLAKQKESILVRQLNELISRDLLVVEQQSPVLVRNDDSDVVEYRQDIKLLLKDQEYVEKLEAENKELKEKLAGIEIVLGGE